MKPKLFIVIVMSEIVSLFTLLFLLHLGSLPGKIGVTLVLLLPIVFGLHVLEEFIFPGGYVEW